MTIAGALAAGAVAIPAAASPRERALDYLSARQDRSTGMIGPAAGRDADTSWTAIAVAGAREDAARWRPAAGAPTLADAVTALTPTTVADVLRVAVARRAAGRVDDQLAAQVAAQQSVDGSFEGGMLATAWGLMALRAVGRRPDDPTLGAAVSALMRVRSPDGGWTTTPSAGASDVIGTATAIQALRAARMRVTDPVLVAARARLLALRDRDGGFGRAAVPTAWAVLAIRALGERPGRGPWARGGSPLAVLAALQRADGGVRTMTRGRASVFATAVAALAWSGRVLPVAPGARATPARAPRVLRRTPATGDAVTGVLSVRYADERGGTGIDPRRTTVTVNGRDISRRARITPFTLQVRPSALPDGVLDVAVRIRDRAGHVTISRWSVVHSG
ncbi:MAG: hypothetical protein ABGX38_00755 [Thermoleophilia bacterium]